MGKGLFVTGTGTDVGKTYVAALMVKKLHEAGYGAGYYKAALSGSATFADSDAGYVKRISGIAQPEETLLSYLYPEAVSPHLAARLDARPVELERVLADYAAVRARYAYTTVEGSGGIVCPIRWDGQEHILLEALIRAMGLATVVVADAGLGTINACVLTVEYLRSRGIGVRGVLLNRYTGGVMQEDNVAMVEQLAGVPVLARVRPGDTELDMDAAALAALYESEAGHDA